LLVGVYKDRLGQVIIYQHRQTSDSPPSTLISVP
jgi:hypothetical protein